jgi:putative transposase
MSREITIIKGHVSADHIHLLVSCPPALSPAKIAQYLKGASSRKLQDEFPHRKKRYWGQHLWGRGYFCASVGAVTEDQIKDYIEKHQEEPPDENFSIDEFQS